MKDATATRWTDVHAGSCELRPGGGLRQGRDPPHVQGRPGAGVGHLVVVLPAAARVTLRPKLELKVSERHRQSLNNKIALKMH